MPPNIYIYIYIYTYGLRCHRIRAPAEVCLASTRIPHSATSQLCPNYVPTVSFQNFMFVFSA